MLGNMSKEKIHILSKKEEFITTVLKIRTDIKLLENKKWWLYVLFPKIYPPWIKDSSYKWKLKKLSIIIIHTASYKILMVAPLIPRYLQLIWLIPLDWPYIMTISQNIVLSKSLKALYYNFTPFSSEKTFWKQSLTYMDKQIWRKQTPNSAHSQENATYYNFKERTTHSNVQIAESLKKAGS